jgi:recombination protein RecA
MKRTPKTSKKIKESGEPKTDIPEEVIVPAEEPASEIEAVVPGAIDVGDAMSRISQTMSKQFGEKSMMHLKDYPEYTQVHNWVSTQNAAIDWVCSGKADGTGGLPVGRIIELFGDPSSGKSLLLTQILAEVQSRGGIPVLYDPESTFDGFFAQRVGLQVSNLMYSKCYKDADRKKMVLGKDGKLHTQMIKVRLPSTIEQLKDEIEELLDITYHEYPGVLMVIGLDSVAALSTVHELKEPDKKDFTKAGGIRSFVKMMEAKMADQNCMFIATNHVIANINIKNIWERRDKVKEAPKEDKSAPGGSGLPFGSSVRLDLTRGHDIKEQKIFTVGHEIFVYSHKNKVYPPRKTTVVEMRFDTGMNRYSGLLDILVAKEIVEEMGDKVYRYKGMRFKERAQPQPKYPGFSDVVVKYPEIPSLANEV